MRGNSCRDYRATLDQPIGRRHKARRTGRVKQNARHEPHYLAITTVVQELLSLGKSRFVAMQISSRGRSPRMIGQ